MKNPRGWVNGSMSKRFDPLDNTKRQRARPQRSRSGGMLPVLLLLPLAVGIGGVVLKGNYGGFGVHLQTAAAQPLPMSAAAASDAAAPSTDPLQQSLKDLQTTQQQTADKLEATQRRLASEQGERKLLSEQVAALSGRVDALSASNASVRTATAPALPKKKPVAPPPALPVPH
jgi:uncharacterized protein HemX